MKKGHDAQTTSITYQFSLKPLTTETNAGKKYAVQTFIERKVDSLDDSSGNDLKGQYFCVTAMGTPSLRTAKSTGQVNSWAASISIIQPDRDGEWSEWSSFGSCSVSQKCGNLRGNSQRTRTCNSPLPLNNGHYCQGDSKEKVQCRRFECPTNGHHYLLKSCLPAVKSYMGISQGDFSVLSNQIELLQNRYSEIYESVWLPKPETSTCRSKITMVGTVIDLNKALKAVLKLCKSSQIVNHLEVIADSVKVTKNIEANGIKKLDISCKSFLTYDHVNKIKLTQTNMPKARDGINVRNYGQNGQNGANGQYGADGTVMTIKADHVFIRSGSLEIHTYGGNGGAGGHGSNGMKGEDGADGAQDPRFKSEGWADNKRRYSCNGYQCTTCDPRIRQNDGVPGGNGGKGGNGGNGGAGGLSGLVYFSTSKIYGEIFIVNVRGRDGAPGNSGSGGAAGKGGFTSHGIDSYSCISGKTIISVGHTNLYLKMSLYKCIYRATNVFFI